jgi:hypothetical protein
MRIPVRRAAGGLAVALLLARAAGAQPVVAPAELSRLSPSDFRDDELDLPYYLTHFHRLANAIALDGPRKGFIDLAVWRDRKDNEPHNARVMESVLSLAFFYATDRPWNRYRSDSAVRARLEAALDFWVRSQSPDGRFSEYAPGRWSLAPTAFGTKFMGEALRLLRDGPPIDAALHRRVIDADRRAILAVLTRQDLWEHGRRFTNQFGNVWAGALAYLALCPDAEIARLLSERMAVADTAHQSPAGYFYEWEGPDWGYNLNTHHSDVHMAWHYARGTPLGRTLEEGMRRWYEWLGYNAVPEPGETALSLNRAIETRQRRAVVDEAGPEESDTGTPLAEPVPAARVLGPTREGLARRRAERRAELVRRWPAVDSLAVGTFRAFSPYAFLHRAHAGWHPTDAQRRAAVAALPHQARDRFTHLRTDSRHPVTFAYVRRPAYYAAFTAGPVFTAQQRYGIGLLWVLGAGTVLQSQTGATATAWGTRPEKDSLVFEADTLAATHAVGGRPVSPTTGNHGLPAGDYRVEYQLGTRGRKVVTFGDRGVRVEVTHADAFVEQLPLLALPTDSIVARPGVLTLRRGGARVVVRWAPASAAAVTRTGESSGPRRVVAVAIRGSGALTYDIELYGSGGAR